MQHKLSDLCPRAEAEHLTRVDAQIDQYYFELWLESQGLTMAQWQAQQAAAIVHYPPSLPEDVPPF